MGAQLFHWPASSSSYDYHSTKTAHTHSITHTYGQKDKQCSSSLFYSYPASFLCVCLTCVKDPPANAYESTAGHSWFVSHSIPCALSLSIPALADTVTLALTCCGSETPACSPDRALSPALSSALGPGSSPYPSRVPSLCPDSCKASTLWHGHSSPARASWAPEHVDKHLRRKVRIESVNSMQTYRNVHKRSNTLFSFSLQSITT